MIETEAWQRGADLRPGRVERFSCELRKSWRKKEFRGIWQFHKSIRCDYPDTDFGGSPDPSIRADFTTSSGMAKPTIPIISKRKIPMYPYRVIQFKISAELISILKYACWKKRNSAGAAADHFNFRFRSLGLQPHYFSGILPRHRIQARRARPETPVKAWCGRRIVKEPVLDSPDEPLCFLSDS